MTCRLDSSIIMILFESQTLIWICLYLGWNYVASKNFKLASYIPYLMGDSGLLFELRLQRVTNSRWIRTGDGGRTRFQGNNWFPLLPLLVFDSFVQLTIIVQSVPNRMDDHLLQQPTSLKNYCEKYDNWRRIRKAGTDAERVYKTRALLRDICESIVALFILVRTN